MMNTELLMWALLAAIVTVYVVFLVPAYLTKHKMKKPHRKLFVMKLLENLRSDELRNSDGICAAFHKTSDQSRKMFKYEVRRKYSDEYLDLLTETCKELGVYSGHRLYPIADNSNRGYSGKEAYNLKRIKWGDSTAYSRAREAVLVRLIEKYEAILEELS